MGRGERCTRRLQDALVLVVWVSHVAGALSNRVADLPSCHARTGFICRRSTALHGKELR